MIRTTPFHPRLSELNTQGLYTHWQGHLSALRYTHAPKHEYFAVRNSVGVFDTSPLFKYRITGPDAERLLAGVLARDIRSCRPGQAQYTLWCDDRGLRHGGRRRLPARRRPTSCSPPPGPTSAGSATTRGRLRVEIEDVSDDYGILAVQGPRSRAGPRGARRRRSHGLGFFDARPGQDRRRRGDAVAAPATPATSATRSPSPPTGAVDVLDAVLEAGEGHGMRPFGEEALMMLRIEAGLPLVDVEWHNSRTAFTDARAGHAQGARPGLDAARRARRRPRLRRRRRDPARAGRRAPRAGRASGSSSTGTTGTGCTATPGCSRPRTSTRCPTSRCCTTPAGDEQVGYATSFMYSPVLQRHIGLARVRPELAPPDCPAPRAAGDLAAATAPPRSPRPPRATAHFDPPARRPRTGGDRPMSTSSTVRRDRRRRRPQRPDQRRLPRQGRAAHAGARAPRTSSAAPPSPRSWCRASRSRRSPTR